MNRLSKLVSGKKILITQNAIQRIEGSENVALELAVLLKQAGADVRVFTWHIGQPMIDYFNRADIPVITDEDDSFFDGCDYVWVHHQVIPRRLLAKLHEDANYRPAFIFLHMSAMKDLLLEQPYVYGLEEKIASKILYVSPEAKDALRQLHVFKNIKCPEAFFENPAPDEYANLSSRGNTKLGRILVVSNHPPEEILGAINILRQKGLNVDLLGAGGNYTKITPDMLGEYDAVVEIGKTTQYCLVAGTPVYIYDKFGGPGYLNGENFEKAAWANFSGRRFNAKTASEIAAELISGFHDAKMFVTKNRKKFIKKYALSKNILEIFGTLNKPTYKIDDQYFWYITATECNIAERIRLNWAFEDVREDNKKLLQEIGRVNSELELRIANSIHIRGIRYVKKMGNMPKIVRNRIATARKKVRMLRLYKTRVKCAEKNGFKVFDFRDDQVFIVRKDYLPKANFAILMRIRNESLILPDTLAYLSRLGDDLFVYDDASTDQTFEMLCKDKNVKVIIANLNWRPARTTEETRSRKELLDSAKQYSAAEWFLYTDADERITDFDLDKLFALPRDIDGVRIRLYDAYMTKEDHEPFKHGDTLLDFRKSFGPEYRDILMLFRNRDYIYYAGLDAREPIGCQSLANMYACQHYGKAISETQWEETCRYYSKNFEEPYKTKWKNRMGKSIHEKSDFGGDLYPWGDDLFSHQKNLME